MDFLPDNGFTSMSKPRRNLESKECDYFYSNETKNLSIYEKNKMIKMEHEYFIS